MFRKMLFAALVGLSLTSWGATTSFAQDRSGSRWNSNQPQLYLNQRGLKVTRVYYGSTAAAQGIEAGDIIVTVDGNAVRGMDDLNHWIDQAGETAELEVIDWRSGRVNQVMVYPDNGRIGVTGRDVSLDNVRPIRPIYPPWDRPVRPIKPIYPPQREGRPIPLPLPVKPGNRPGQPQPLPLPGGNFGTLPGR